MTAPSALDRPQFTGSTNITATVVNLVAVVTHKLSGIGALRAQRRVVCRQATLLTCCCAGDEGFVALRRRSSGNGVKPPHGALAEDCCAEQWGKSVVRRQVGDRKANANEPLMKCRYLVSGIRTGVTS